MIACFPEPYPDELLYSVCARLSDRLGYRLRSDLVSELFGSRESVSIVYLPCNINRMVSNIANKGEYTSDYIINNHTLFPFYAPFLPLHRRERLLNTMKEGDGKLIHLLSGILPSRISSSENLRYCPMCMIDDQKIFGECFWHRSHQIHCVVICPTHNVWIEESNIPVYSKKYAHQFISIERSSAHVMPRYIDSSHECYDFLIQITHDVNWLLHQERLSLDHEILRKHYTFILTQRGLSTYSGIVAQSEIRKKFINHFPEELLTLLHCPLYKDTNTWLSKIVQSNVGALPSITYLLFAMFLGYSITTILDTPTKWQPFGTGPWPCLNAVSDHYKQLRITKCDIYDSDSPGQSGKPIGVFKCDCGMTYTRQYSEQSEADTFSVQKIREYGHIWESLLKQLWNNSEISLKKLSAQLSVNTKIAMRQAIILNLPFPRPGRDGPIIDGKRLSLHKRGLELESSKIERYRIEWLCLLQEVLDNPSMHHSLTQHSIYAWLRKHDAEWLLSHKPPRSTRKEVHFDHNVPRGRSASIDWSERDRFFAKSVQGAVIYLKSCCNPYIRITKFSIGAELENGGMMVRQLSKLPLTNQIIFDSCETIEDFAIRKIISAFKYYQQSNITPTREEIINHAKVRQNLHLLRVSGVIDDNILNKKD